MRGEWNGLQALFLQKCPYAYYVHCFAHRLQLALNAAAKDVGVIYLFFQMLTSIINVDSSAKRVSELKSIQEVEVVEQIAAGELETGKGANQTCNLQRAGATRWSSRYYSIKNLMKLYNSTSSVLKNMIDNGLNGKIRGEALGASKALRSFDFVFCLLLLEKTMGITNALCKSLQEQSQEIINAMNLVYSTKGRLKKLRENGWVDFFASVVSFCDAHTIEAPDFSARHMEATTERAFSAMKLIKNRLRSKMSDDFLADLMTVHIEREIVDTIDSNSVIDEFYALGNRRAQLK
ncbi:zinc finger protein 862 [Rosa chinensis]|uniref:zinc finger protein 862 n=1 Tax=Rosa chinensis TaxID=74649 RepID=UPI001AD9434A|nr:zinc finger protein 862 [Rosa chinensis]